ncbi:MAG TPA: glycosyltransferase [Bacteroidales bacterium]|nr:glycosyltransferase [Bacteroidales bacterium]
MEFMKSEVSILIPVFNRLQTTIRGLRSLFSALDNYKLNGKQKVNYSIVVIDDASSDGTPAWIASNYSEIHLIRTEGNLWWTGAINRGADYSIKTLRSDYLLLWNDDVQPGDNYFLVVEDLIVSALLQNTVAGSKILSSGSGEMWSQGGYFNRLTGNLGMMVKGHTSGCEIIDCDWQPGMGTIIPVKSILSAGLRWDEKRFPHYSGDSDFTLRCGKKGMRICTCLNLVLYNNTSETGFVRKQDIRDLWVSFTSLKSIYNIKINLRFYSRHGILPFAYMGMISRYFFYLGGYMKHSVLKWHRRQPQIRHA